jgi:hypothetical protein
MSVTQVGRQNGLCQQFWLKIEVLGTKTARDTILGSKLNRVLDPSGSRAVCEKVEWVHWLGIATPCKHE